MLLKGDVRGNSGLEFPDKDLESKPSKSASWAYDAQITYSVCSLNSLRLTKNRLVRLKNRYLPRFAPIKAPRAQPITLPAPGRAKPITAPKRHPRAA